MSGGEHNGIAAVVGEFDARVQAEVLDGLAIKLRLSGGMPSQARREEYELQGRGTATGLFRDAVSAPGLREASYTMTPEALHDLFGQLAAGLRALLQQPQPRFLPDSLVGAISVDVEGRGATVYFVPEVGMPGRPTRLPTEVREVIDTLRATFVGLFPGGVQT